MALANHRLMPDIEVVALITNEEHTFLSSTTVREMLRSAAMSAAWSPPRCRGIEDAFQ